MFSVPGCAKARLCLLQPSAHYVDFCLLLLHLILCSPSPVFACLQNSVFCFEALTDQKSRSGFNSPTGPDVEFSSEKCYLRDFSNTAYAILCKHISQFFCMKAVQVCQVAPLRVHGFYLSEILVKFKPACCANILPTTSFILIFLQYISFNYTTKGLL